MIHIIIPVHNRLCHTIDCLESISLHVKSDCSVTVVDDGSTDGTADFLNNNYQYVDIITGDGSLFWTGCMNAGVENVLKKANIGDFIMSLNNDVTLTGCSIKELLLEAKEERKSLYGSLSLNGRDRDTIITSGTIVKSWFFNITSHVYKSRSYACLKDYSAVKVNILTGRSVLYPIEIFKTIGNFDSINFPHYGGDDEFTIRAQNFGWGLSIVPRSIVYVDQTATGQNPTVKSLTLKLLFQSIFSIRSTNNIIVRTRLANKIVPWYSKPTYIVIMSVKILMTVLLSLPSSVRELCKK